MLTYTLGQVLAYNSRWKIRCKGTHRIYIIVDDDSIALYVGQSSNVRARVKQHYHNPQSEIGRVMHEFMPQAEGWTIYFLTLADCAAYHEQITKALGRNALLYTDPVDQAEYTAIWCLRPIFNKMLNSARAPHGGK